MSVSATTSLPFTPDGSDSDEEGFVSTSPLRAPISSSEIRSTAVSLSALQLKIPHHATQPTERKTYQPHRFTKGIQTADQNLKDRLPATLMHFPSPERLMRCLNTQIPEIDKNLGMRGDLLVPYAAVVFSNVSGEERDVLPRVRKLCKKWQETANWNGPRKTMKMFEATLGKALLACHKQESAFKDRRPVDKVPERSTRSMITVGDGQIAVQGEGNVIVQGSGNSAVVENDPKINVIVQNPSSKGSTVTVNGETYMEGIHRVNDGIVIVEK